ncbi:peptide/nickel transport system substrate-binding protein [Variovorax boronicumulans]|jgi:peptide/nickel transport system substrate-binding protein|uniref:Peptide/nickel transport system substrate-binding protein n=2 Tax=Variovorax TaxID=34072 RepID=A0AAW8CUQ9_9BURK|nr:MULTISPECIES: ABC transporter substrate-binding protein [Variovorax]ADU35392.1 extracellular solute-binding protein family 5 [Variovorax paradoxus EPS]MDP9895153.1 peptide/nickel transport system substrate-binding protein [Variovorax boronicumulans]MDP9992485.1 peptide/nickel transport system substrate-binding protein [Variovorax boronicumulans]MDQ0002343.1 peptide/nickel transport system substrate-binding protein [Variovorax boronicumulans]MDQ0037228.1 peptide/nickel transport system subst
MSFKKKAAAVAVLCALGAVSLVASAQTIRIANQGDALSLDPHSLNESLQLSVTANVYETLVGRNKDLSLAPLLATSWKQTSPNVWRFELRKGVVFHDGTPFTADDVVFSFARAQGDGSDMRATLSDIKAVRKVGDLAVEIETNGPFPILPDVISLTMIMSKKWCEENQATKPVDRRKGIENTASFKANGTGPFRVRERQPNVRTVFTRNGTYWGKIDGNAQEIVFTPIANPATRVAALVSGEVDVMEPVPVQDIARINAAPNARVITGPEMRTIFLGMDQKRDELLYSNIKGKNPFKDKRVRQAFYQAIDIVGIQRTVMRGASKPTGLLVGPGINGWTAEQDKRLPFDVEAAKKLMAEAGYASGFEVTMNCPNDRYVNDGQICQSVAANLAKINVKINLAAETKGTYFPKILRRDTSFYMLGWTPTTYDSHNALSSLTACPDDKGTGQFNLGAYCNPKLDELTKKIQSESDKAKRNELIKEAFKLHADDIGTLPLHQQSLAWGVSKKVELVQLADNFMYFKWMSVKP